jgi:outer membrane lipoprotein-sorting protein
MAGWSCRYTEPRLRALLDGELAEVEAARVRDHLADCNACQGSLATVAEVSRLVSEIPAEIEPPPHFSANLQLRLASVRARKGLRGWLGLREGARPRWSRRYSLAGVTVAGTALALILGSPPRLGAQDLVGKVQESWSRLQSYSCHFVAVGVVDGKPRRFEQQQWFRKPNLFRLETNEHYPEQTFVQADRVTTYIPGADWQGRRIAITRPRRDREEGLPFPFGAEWPIAYDVTMDALVRELKAQQAGEMLGTEVLLEKYHCYVLKFHTRRPGSRLPTHYRVWVDRESFLPLKVKSYRDTRFHWESTASNLRTNIVLPGDMFRYTPSDDTFQVYGEAEPFVFTLPMDQPRTAAFEQDPVGSGRAEISRRAVEVTFRPLAPTYLPADYGLVRVRRARGRGWLDAYWLHPRTGAVIKLLEEDGTQARVEEGEPLSLPGYPRRPARWHEVRRPKPIQYFSWKQEGVRLTLAAAGIDRAEALRVAASFTPATPEE